MKKLNLEAGQTWRTRSGNVVHVESVTFDGRVVMIDAECPSRRYVVNEFGKAMRIRHELAERMPRVYIAGPMSGYPDLNFPAFHAAAAEYRNRGCFVINPAEINIDGVDNMTVAQKDAHWVKCMRADIAALLGCEEVVMLNGWQKSKGASLEHHIALNLGLTVSYPVDTYNEVQHHPV